MCQIRPFPYRGELSRRSISITAAFSRILLDAVNHDLGDRIAPVAQGGFEIAPAVNSSVDMDKAFTAADLRATASATTLEKERAGNGRTQFVISLSTSVIGRSEHGYILRCERQI